MKNQEQTHPKEELSVKELRGKELQPLAKEILLAMYGQECEQARHHEDQREKAIALVIQIIAAISAVGCALLSTKYVSPASMMILAGIVILLSIFGSVYSMKHFERSMHCFARSNAYRVALVNMVDTDLIDFVFPNKDSIPGIKDVLDAREAEFKAENEKTWDEEKLETKVRKDGDGPLVPESLMKDKYEREKLNPLIAETFIEPFENPKHRWGNHYLADPQFDLYKLPAFLFSVIGVFALVALIIALAILLPQAS